MNTSTDFSPEDIVVVREPGSRPVKVVVVGYWRSGNWQVRDRQSQTTYMAHGNQMRLWFRK